jgi:paraquat-inducible protein A
MLSNQELDQFIICKKCNTLHRKIPLHQGGKALCSKCNTLIYQRDDNMLEKTLALVITTLISLLVAFQFTIISININGLEQSLSLMSLFAVLLEYHQYLVGLMFLFLIVLFPLMMLSSMFFILFFMKIQKYGYIVRRLLILLSRLKHWSMLDIFFISLLVAMVKLFDYARIELGISFMALILTLALELIITKNISFDELWQKHNLIYGENSDRE